VHICLITPSFPPQVDGGVAISTGRVVDRFLAMGHRLTVLTITPKESVADVVMRAQPHAAALAVYDRTINDPLRDAGAVTDVLHWAETQHRQTPFDVILAYFLYPGGYLATVLGARLGLPVVCSGRGNDISKDMFIDPHTIATVLRASTRLIFVSTSLLHMANTLVPCRAKATVIANAVDTTQFMPDAASAQRSSRPVTLGTSGVMRWKKGIDLFLPLVGRLCTTHDVRVVIAGYGLDAAIEQHITGFLQHHGLGDRLTVTGALLHHEMVQALHSMDIYVSTSYQEGMPNSVLEAMACALPVVATDADGTTELVQDGVTGYVCPMGDITMLEARCHRLIEQPALRRRMGTAGRRRVLQYFQPDREASEIEAVLRQACAL
jgi:glycosyltransferase involved in cell wall biosynthesis